MASTVSHANRVRTLRVAPLAAVMTVIAVVSFAARPASAQEQPKMAGHWKGTIQPPGLDVEIDLATKGGSAWYGTITIPAQGAKGVPLANLSVKTDALTFTIKGAPGDPGYTGTLAADGKTINGTFSQGGGSVPLVLTRTGDATFAVAAPSTPITKDVEGKWEGALDVQGKVLHLVLTLGSDAGRGTGTLVSVDQNNLEIPIATVTQKGTHLNLIVSMISGTWDGELKNGELTGTWAQGPLLLPLVFKRAVK
jgi:hypothetical protein